MTLTDNELCMIEQLTYLNSSVSDAASDDEYKCIFSGINSSGKNKTIGELLECFDDTALKNLSDMGNKTVGETFTSGKEWAEIIKYLKNNQTISNLVLSDTMTGSDGTTLALCFTEDKNLSQAIVAFKGTSGKDEWVDNVEGLNLSDTECQKDALAYIEGLNFSDITVTGHSKGGNKAMYVAITSDKVGRCVAYDGQGFSQKFIDKYWAEIEQRGKNIKNYSLSTDYVHALMFPVPNSSQIYCSGYGVYTVAEHHCSNSFFKTDKNGNLVLDEHGNPVVVEIEEDESIKMLHSFTTFIMNNAENEDKEIIIGYVSKLLSMTFGGDKISIKEFIDFALADPDTLAIIVAYLIKYMDEYDLDADDIDKLLEVINLNKLNTLITIKELKVFDYQVDVNLNLANIINLVKKQLSDGDDDWFIKNVLLPILKKSFFDDVDIDVSSFWAKVNSKVKSIEVKKEIGNYQAKTGEIHDFSKKVYDTLMSTINKINNLNFGNLSGWNNYAQYEWFSKLFISFAIKGINSYADNLIQLNNTNKKRIDELFETISKIDTIYAGKIKKQNEILKSINRNLSNCTFRLN